MRQILSLPLKMKYQCKMYLQGISDSDVSDKIYFVIPTKPEINPSPGLR